MEAMATASQQTYTYGKLTTSRPPMQAPERLRKQSYINFRHLSSGPQSLHTLDCGLNSPLKWPSRSKCARKRHASTSAKASADKGPERHLEEKASALKDHLRGSCIFLVGMMGSGKSTVGKILAQSLGYYFFDSDAVVEQAVGGATVAQIFEENGEEAFRDLETRVLSELSAMGRLVVATGGGAVIRPSNWASMRHGVTVLIDVPLEELASRIVTAGAGSRPLVASGSKQGSSSVDEETEGQTSEYQEVLARLTRLWSERKGMYAHADVTIDTREISFLDGVDLAQVGPRRIAYQIIKEIEILVLEKRGQASM